MIRLKLRKDAKSKYDASVASKWNEGFRSRLESAKSSILETYGGGKEPSEGPFNAAARRAREQGVVVLPKIGDYALWGKHKGLRAGAYWRVGCGRVEEFSGEGGGRGLRREVVEPEVGEEAWMSESTPWRGAAAYFKATGDEDKCEWMRRREEGEVEGRDEEVEVVAWCVALAVEGGEFKGCYEYLI